MEYDALHHFHHMKKFVFWQVMPEQHWPLPRALRIGMGCKAANRSNSPCYCEDLQHRRPPKSADARGVMVMQRFLYPAAASADPDAPAPASSSPSSPNDFGITESCPGRVMKPMRFMPPLRALAITCAKTS